MRKVRLVSVCLVLVGSTLSRPAAVLPEMARHLAFADRCLKAGDLEGVLASTDLILLPHLHLCIDSTMATPSAVAGLNEALVLWRQATDEGIAFSVVEDPKHADVVVRFQSRLGTGDTDYGGFTTWKRSVARDGRKAAWSLCAQMELRTIQPSGEPMSVAQVRHAALHELGHVLGLADSKRVGDVMGPLDLSRPVGRPSLAEVDELKRLRRGAIDIRNRALAEFLSGP